MRLPHFETRTKDFESIAANARQILVRNGERGIPQEERLTLTMQILMGAFFDGKRRIYKLARDFAKELNKVDLKIQARYFPTIDEPICIEFPDDMVIPTAGGVAGCAYVTCFSKPCPDGRHPNNHKQFHFVVPSMKDEANYDDQYGLFSSIFVQDEDNLDKAFCEPEGASELFKFLVKCLVYINSGEPDLRHCRAIKPPDTRNVKKLRRFWKMHENHSSVDMVLVGYNWKKPVTYTVDEIPVSGHPRWQPYGPRREKVKLIWIAPYVKHVNKHEAPEQRAS